jgi:hypothetical protein
MLLAIFSSLLKESKFFIEWIVGEANIDAAAELVQLQVQLSLWERAWKEISQDSAKRQELANSSGKWSQRILELSGLLG